MHFRTGRLDNDAGLPVLQSMNNKLKAGLEENMKMNSPSLSNWLSVLAMMLPIALGYGYRIKVEERFMIEQMGESYLNYQKQTRRIIPTIY